MIGDNSGEGLEALLLQDEKTRLKDQSLKAILVEGQRSLLVELVARLNANQASKDDLALLGRMLKDNGMVYEPGKEPELAQGPQPDLPDLPDEVGYD